MPGTSHLDIVFGLAIAHLVRLIKRWAVQIGSISVPMYISWIGLIISALLSIWGFSQ
jgi:hypothetical protein